MSRSILSLVALVLLAGARLGYAQAENAAAPPPAAPAAAPPPAAPPPPAKPLPPETHDKLVAPIALYPDALVTQILTCSVNPQGVKEVSAWLKENPDLKGTPAQDAASDKGFDAAFIA